MIRKFFRAIEDWVFDEDSIFLGMIKGALVIGPLVGALVLGLVILLSTLDKDPKVVLDEKEWHCTATRTELVPVLVGKIFISEPQEVCTAWERNQ